LPLCQSCFGVADFSYEIERGGVQNMPPLSVS
jgi:hypothetical protein